MKLTGIIKRFENKKFVVKLKEQYTTKWVVTNPTTGQNLEFFENGRGSGEVLYFTSRHPETDSSVDLFMDTYLNTVKAAINFLDTK